MENPIPVHNPLQRELSVLFTYNINLNNKKVLNKKNNMKTIKLNVEGIIHHLVIIIVAVVVAVSAIGVGVYEYANSSSHKSHAAGWTTVGWYNNDKVFACSTAVSGGYGNLEHVGVYSNGGEVNLITVQSGKGGVSYSGVSQGSEGFIWASKDLNQYVIIANSNGDQTIAQVGPGTSYPWQNLAYC